MKKKILLGIVPVMASAAIIAGGYAAWVFGTNDSVKGQIGVSVTAEQTGVSAGKFSVSGLNTYSLVQGQNKQDVSTNNAVSGNYQLVLDQTANEINTAGKSAHFENSLSVTFEFLDSIKQTTDYTYTFDFALSLEVSASLLDYVSLSYGNVTISKEDVSHTVSTATKTIISATGVTNTNEDYVLFNSESQPLVVTYINEPTNSDELKAMQEAVEDATIEFTATAVATLDGDSVVGA